MSVNLDVVLQPPDAVWLLAVAQSLSQGMIAFQYASHRRQSKVSGDSKPLNAFLSALMVLTLLQTALELYKSFCVLVHRASWTQDPLRWAELILNGILCNAIQGFFIRRCWQATRSRALLFALCTTLLLVLSANLWLTIDVLGDVARASRIKAKHDKLAHEYTKTVNIMFGIYIGGSAALDSAITAVLIAFLYQARTGLPKLDAVVFKILNLTWEVQALPMASAIVACSLYFTRHFGYVLFFSVMTGKLYVHGLLRTLNMRAQLRRRVIQEEMCMHDLQPWLLRTKAGTHSPQTSQSGHDGGQSSQQLPHSLQDAATEPRAENTNYHLTERTGHSTLTPDGASAV